MEIPGSVRNVCLKIMIFQQTTLTLRNITSPPAASRAAGSKRWSLSLRRLHQMRSSGVHQLLRREGGTAPWKLGAVFFFLCALRSLQRICETIKVVRNQEGNAAQTRYNKALPLTSYLKCCQWQEIQHIFISKLGCRNQRQSQPLLEMPNNFYSWPFRQDHLNLPY